MTNDSTWIVTEISPDEQERAAKELLSVGDTVMCISEISRHRGQIGRVIHIGWSVQVEYPDTHLMGLHPAKILRKVNVDFFEPEFHEEDLFKI